MYETWFCDYFLFCGSFAHGNMGVFVPCFSKKLNNRLRKKRIALTIGMLFVSLLFLHLFTLNRNGIAVQTILDAFLLALKTFLADGGITIEWHFNQIDETLNAIYNHEPPEKLAICMKTIAAIGDVAAPLLTLTTVINLLSEFFPKIRISFSLFREKFVFSEVNEETVVLAESIHNQFAGRIRKPMLIATDVYVDKENENASEHVERLKKIGCICIKNDILSLSVRVVYPAPRTAPARALNRILPEENRTSPDIDRTYPNPVY